MKRSVEIFTAGCPVCNPVIKLVKKTACDNCEITVYDVVKQCDEKVCVDKTKAYGINQLPSVVVDGQLLDCCSREITEKDLLAAGVGQAQK